MELYETMVEYGAAAAQYELSNYSDAYWGKLAAQLLDKALTLCPADDRPALAELLRSY